MDYQAYLQTEHWRTLRRLALEQADGRCALCNSDTALEVHHRTYERLGAERLSDLVVLCETCHARHHQTLEQAREDARTSERIVALEAELDSERRGAMFLAAQVERAWTDGVERGAQLMLAYLKQRKGQNHGTDGTLESARQAHDGIPAG